MFGYIRPEPSELKVKEYELYKSVYCGLCRSMGRCTGCTSPLTLSYDFVFLTLIRSALAGDELEVRRIRCALHPFRRKTAAFYAGEGESSLDYSARASALLGYRNVKDNIADSRVLGKIAQSAVLPVYAAARKTALRKAPAMTELDALIKEKLTALSELEKKREPSPEPPAQLFGELLAAVFSFGFDGLERRIAWEIGLHTGRWIYLTDALDDLADDIKSESYNPFAAGRPSPETCETALRLELAGIERALALIQIKDAGVKSIIENIIYIGMAEVSRRTSGPGGDADEGPDKELK